MNRNIGACVQIVLRMTPHQRTVIYRHLSTHLTGVDLAHLNMIFSIAERMAVANGQV